MQHQHAKSGSLRSARDDIRNYAIASTRSTGRQCTSANSLHDRLLANATTTTGNHSLDHGLLHFKLRSSPGDMLVVSMTYPYALNLPLVRSFNLHLASTSEMIVAQ